jgi:glycosyltransferase involved in cell wall biosynthesis
MPKLSLSMIVKDEEDSLADVLADARAFCDELVVADTGSSDRTRQVAADAGARVIEVPWTDDFAAARNAALDACTGDWVLWLDADDRVPPDSQHAFATVVADLDDDVDAVLTPYHYAFDARGQCSFTVVRERVLRRDAGLRWQGAVHEVVDIVGVNTREEPSLIVEHRRTPAHTGRNLRILQRLYEAGDRSPRTLFYRANELRDNGRHEEAVAAYDEALTAERPEWERYYALTCLGQSLQVLGRDEEALAAALEAVRLDPGRPEAWMTAGRVHYERGHWVQAAPFFSAASTAPVRPFSGFVNDADHRWAPWDYLSVCLGNSGRHREALEAGLRALEGGNPGADRVRANIGWFVSELSPD